MLQANPQERHIADARTLHGDHLTLPHVRKLSGTTAWLQNAVDGGVAPGRRQHPRTSCSKDMR